jgi:hypothetical protein
VRLARQIHIPAVGSRAGDFGDAIDTIHGLSDQAQVVSSAEAAIDKALTTARLASSTLKELCL